MLIRPGNGKKRMREDDTEEASDAASQSGPSKPWSLEISTPTDTGDPTTSQIPLGLPELPVQTLATGPNGLVTTPYPEAIGVDWNQLLEATPESSLHRYHLSGGPFLGANTGMSNLLGFGADAFPSDPAVQNMMGGGFTDFGGTVAPELTWQQQGPMPNFSKCV